eukprot:g2289.t1
MNTADRRFGPPRLLPSVREDDQGRCFGPPRLVRVTNDERPDVDLLPTSLPLPVPRQISPDEQAGYTVRMQGELWETVVNRTCPSLLRIAYADGRGANEVLGILNDPVRRERCHAECRRTLGQPEKTDSRGKNIGIAEAVIDWLRKDKGLHLKLVPEKDLPPRCAWFQLSSGAAVEAEKRSPPQKNNDKPRQSGEGLSMGRLRNPAAGPQINATAKTLASASRIEVEGKMIPR